MDQVGIQSAVIENKLEDWKTKNLEIFWLPLYSPQLNLIELLWQFMKYEWIEFDAYESLDMLRQYINDDLLENKTVAERFACASSLAYIPTYLTVSHRLAILERADQIVELNAGRVYGSPR